MTSTAEPRTSRMKPAFVILSLLALLAGCHLGQEGGKEQVFSMTALADTLKTFDSVKVLLLGPDGDTLDILYKGKVTAPADLANRPAPHYEGGKAIVSIAGFDDDVVVYRVDRAWDGTSRTIGDIQVHATARTTVRPEGPDRIVINPGDSLPLPAVTVAPSDLSDRRLAWSSSQPGIVALSGTGFKGVSDGEARLTVSLLADPARSGSITVVVRPKSSGIAASKLSLPDDTLRLSVGGGTRRLAVTLEPINADTDLLWETPDGSVLRILPDGAIEGLEKGLGRVVAMARLNPDARDTAWVEVKSPVKVTGVAFERESLSLFVKGAPESLVVRVNPPEADQAVDFAFDSNFVTVRDNKVFGRAKGATRVTATSRKDPAFQDEIRVDIAEPEMVKAVILSQDTATLYAGGDSLKLEAAVDPATSNQGVRWSSSKSEFATVDSNGVVRGLKQGLAIVTAVSRLDGSKSASCAVSIRTDAPILLLDLRDTVVAIRSPVTFDAKATQAHGRITRFEWKVQGDSAQSGSSATVKPVTLRFDAAREVNVTFVLEDSEGNRTQGTKKVIVVDGPAINFLKPSNNAFTNQTPIEVAWSVNDTPQTTGLTEALKPGPNTLTRRYIDANKVEWSRSITVTLDLEAPLPPAVSGTALTRTRSHSWTWSTGGRGGHGLFRWRLDTNDLSAADPRREASLTLSALQDGVHTLFVQERDSAGNWSESGQFAVFVDATPPGKPDVKSAAARTNDPTPTWTWTSGGGGWNGTYRWVLGAFDSTKATLISQAAFTPVTALAEGSHTLHVQERDSVGNWSEPGSYTIVVDLTGPGKPVVTSAAQVTNDATPTWSWTSGGGGGSGTYRWMMGAFDTTKATVISQPNYTPGSALSEATHTLHVQERDSLGNWSEPGSYAVRVDVTKPPAPIVVAPPSPLNSQRPRWTWSPGGAGGNGQYRFLLNDTNMANAGNGGSLTNNIPDSDINWGEHTLWVQARDSAGNWSDRVGGNVNLVKRDTLGLIGLKPARNLAYTMCPNGKHYVVYADTTRQEKISAAVFENGKWQDIGLGFSEFGATSGPSIACGDEGIVYMAYASSTIGQVYINRGAIWTRLGNSIGETAFLHIAVQRGNSMPYIVAAEGRGGGFLKAYFQPVDLTSESPWRALPAVGFNAVFAHPMFPLQFESNSLGEMHLAFMDRAARPRIRMLKLTNFNATAWTSLTTTGLPDTTTGFSLAFPTSGAGLNVPQMAVANQGKINLYQYAAGGWTAQGPEVGSGDMVSLNFHGTAAYIAYPDKASGGRAALKVRNGTGWTSMSGAGLSAGPSESVVVVNHPATGFPTVGLVEVNSTRRLTIVRGAFDPAP